MSEDSNQVKLRACLSARVNSACFACGLENPRGLGLVFEEGAGGEMSAGWTPERTIEGFEGIVHGGLVSTVLDESMAKAVIALGVEAVTAEIRVRFRRHVVAEQALRVCGWITETTKRVIHAEAKLTDREGSELAHGWASFLVLK